jgi:hypothetical protein
MNRAQREKLASDIWHAHWLLTRGDADERAFAIDEAERLLRDLPPSCFPLFREDTLPLVEAARGGDVDARKILADSLKLLDSFIERAAERAAEARRRRKAKAPTFSKLVAQAEKAGKPVNSVTTPDGVTLHFGTTESAGNEWDEVLLRHGTH